MTIDLVTGEVTTSDVTPRKERAVPASSSPAQQPQPAIQPMIAPVTPTPATNTSIPGGLVDVNVERFIEQMQR